MSEHLVNPPAEGTTDEDWGFEPAGWEDRFIVRSMEKLLDLLGRLKGEEAEGV
ncbi:hypothetical protein H0X09_03605 [Candidatus Saccharibacteria bacterium]|nr:hypothetical protein [Candidatus Saccharibacteria bacterium]